MQLLVQAAGLAALALLVPLALTAILLCALFGLAAAGCGQLARLLTQPSARAVPVRTDDPIVPKAVIDAVRRRRLPPPPDGDGK